MSKASKRVIVIIITIIFLISLFAMVIFYSIKNTKLSFNEDDYIYVPIGSSLNAVIDDLEKKFNLDIAYKVKIYMKFSSLEKEIKPGRHKLKDVSSIYDLISELANDSNEDIRIQIIEGETIYEIGKTLAKNSQLEVFDYNRFISLCKNQDFINQLAEELNFYKVNNLEGFLFPDTYNVDPFYTEKDIIKILVSNFLKKIEPYREDIQTESIDTIMIIASIIEAETEIDIEMDTIASVYYNRIKENMPLQADPTISYSTGRPMKSKDKEIQDPYNTYTKGLHLPPTPIGSPGLSAIEASIYPAKTDYKFMFSPRALDKHLFSKTNFEHNSIIRKYK